MVMQSECVAHWADGKRLAFIGDGDAISVCVAYLKKREIIGYGPSKITVFDFDERIVGAVSRFADRERLELLDAELYNCLDAFPDVAKYDCFYTNPPWGASNNGESVNVFTQRGMEAVKYDGEGLVVIADDDDLGWTHEVLHNAQRFANDQGFFVGRMTPKLHEYHLDDSPELRSCNMFFKSKPGNNGHSGMSQPITGADRLDNFYGRNLQARVRYVREQKRVDYGKANDEEYYLELLEGSDDIH